MKKLVSFVALLLVTATMLSACGSGSGSSSGTVLKIGGIGPLSGDYANYGLSVRNGAMVAVEEINAAGGVNGMTLELDMQDSESSADNAVAAYGKLMDSGMHISIGTVLSGEMASVSLAAAEDDIFLISPS